MLAKGLSLEVSPKEKRKVLLQKLQKESNRWEDYSEEEIVKHD